MSLASPRKNNGIKSALGIMSNCLIRDFLLFDKISTFLLSLNIIWITCAFLCPQFSNLSLSKALNFPNSPPCVKLGALLIAFDNVRNYLIKKLRAVNGLHPL